MTYNFKELSDRELLELNFNLKQTIDKNINHMIEMDTEKIDEYYSELAAVQKEMDRRGLKD